VYVNVESVFTPELRWHAALAINEFVDPLAPCSTYNMFIKKTGIFINTPNPWLDADVRTSPQR
jgi:hypothetical protein